MRTKDVKIDVLLLEKLKTIDTDPNKAIKDVLLFLRNEAKGKEAKFKYDHNVNLLAENNEKLRTLLQDVEAEYAKAIFSGEMQLYDLKQTLVKLELQIKYPRLLSPSYEYETIPEYQELQLKGMKATLEMIKHKMKMLEEGMIKAKSQMKAEYENRKSVLEEQNIRIELEIKRAKEMKESFKFFEGLDDDTKPS